MNIAQRLVLAAGLVVIASLFYAPYTVERYRELTFGGGGRTDITYGRSELLFTWIEFHSVFTPQKNDRIYEDGSTYIIERKRDWALQGSIIAGEVLMLALLFFVFKTKRLKN